MPLAMANRRDIIDEFLDGDGEPLGFLGWLLLSAALAAAALVALA